MKNKLILKKLFEVERVSFFPIYLMDLAATYSVKKILGTVCDLVICYYRGINAVMFVDKESWREVCDVAQKNYLKVMNFSIL